MRTGEIVPGVRIGDLCIGHPKDEVVALVPDGGTWWERGDGFCTYAIGNLKLWFEVDGTLKQIGVTKGFEGCYRSIGIGSTMNDATERFGGFYDEGDSYYIPGVDGLGFELDDMEEIELWDELIAPIEWIYVFKV